MLYTEGYIATRYCGDIYHRVDDHHVVKWLGLLLKVLSYNLVYRDMTRTEVEIYECLGKIRE